MAEENRQSGSLDIILDLNFVPQWARKPPDERNFERFKDDSSDKVGGRHGSSRGRSGGGRYGGSGRAGGRSDGRKPARRDDRSGRPGDRSGGNSQQPKYRRPRSESAVASSQQYNRGERRPRFERERIEAAPIRVRFLPEQKALAGLIRQVKSSNRAYPLLDLAGLLMSKAGCCFVKLEVENSETDKVLYQCKKCRTLSFDRSEIETHILTDHIGDYFDMEEVEGDAPTGNFVCVAKCGISGTLLGPPNHHSYNETIKRLHADRFSNMSFESYKERIKMSHEPEDVERWKEESSKTVNYTFKDNKKKLEVEDSPAKTDDVTDESGVTDDVTVKDEVSAEEPKPLNRVKAERYMRDNIIDKTILRTRRAAISEEVAHGISDRSIKFALRDEWQRESRFPIKLSFALRAAFKHKHMCIFKAGKGKGVNFVTAVEPTPLDPDHAIDSIHDVLTFLNENPGCTRKQIAEALRPDVDLQSDEIKKLLQPVQWLVERGHIIEFFNGTLSVPRGENKYNRKKI